MVFESAPESAIAVPVAVVAACSHDGRTLRPPSPGQTQSIVDPTTTTISKTLALSGPWPAGGSIDTRFTCRGADLSPGLKWSGVPDGTKELAIIVTDPTANGYVHWVVTGIHPIVSSLEEGKTPDGVVETGNDSGAVGWKGPCPPTGIHTYRFELHALRQSLTVATGTKGRDIIGKIESATLATAIYTGTFGS